MVAKITTFVRSILVAFASLAVIAVVAAYVGYITGIFIAFLAGWILGVSDTAIAISFAWGYVVIAISLVVGGVSKYV